MRYALTLTAPAATIDAADLDARRLAGVAIPYGQAGDTSAGRLTINPGAIRLPADLRRVKLFREHGRTTPIGFALEATETPDALGMAFHVGATPDGDLALLEAAEGIRDGLSVELHDVKIRDGVVTSAALVGVAQVAVPAFAGAVLTASETPPETVPDTDDDDDDVTDPAEHPASGDPDPDETETETDESETAVTAPVEASRPTPAAERAPVVTAAAAWTDFDVFASLALPRLDGVHRPEQIAAVLNDIIPANTGDPGGAFMRPDWLGELWTPANNARPMKELVGVGNLTAAKFSGWKWTLAPVVASYAGNKTPVPSSPATAAVVESGDPETIAGAWDVARMYVDFNTGLLASFYAKAVESYAAVAEAALAQTVIDNAGAAAAPPDFLSGVIGILTDLTTAGARMDFLAMAPDVFGQFITLPAAEVPWWLQAQSTVDLHGTITLAGIKVGTVPSLPAGALLGGDRRALDYRESGPIRVDAVNIPNGGVDLGLFGYANHIVNDAAGLSLATITPALPLAAKTAAKGK